MSGPIRDLILRGDETHEVLVDRLVAGGHKAAAAERTAASILAAVDAFRHERMVRAHALTCATFTGGPCDCGDGELPTAA